MVVVDNHSTDGSAERIKQKFSRIELTENKENKGFAFGNNVGIDHALENGAEYVLLLNQDTEAEPDFLKNLMKVALSDGKIGLLSPLIVWKRTKKIWFAGGKINWWRMKSQHKTKAGKGEFWKSEFLTGCALLIKREVLEKIGKLDEKFFLYWEDVDFSVRSRRAGFKIAVVPESIVYHFETSETTNKNKVYRLVLSGLIFFRKNTSGFRRVWIEFFVKMRKIKNWFDRVSKKNEEAELVYKAYQDFKNGKF